MSVNSYIHLLILAHVYSQLTYKKTPVWKHLAEGSPLPSPPFRYDWDWSQPKEQVKFREWHELVAMETRFATGYLPRGEAGGSALSTRTIAESVYAHIQACRGAGACYLLWGEKGYPEELLRLSVPPLGIACLGNTELLFEPKVAVVGARKAGAGTLNLCWRLGKLLAEQGIVCVSGGAYGCDIAVHQGMLYGRAKPVLAVVVFAQGLAQLYPRGNTGVFRQLLERGGLLLSERLWTQGARPVDFPIRNRLISGLSAVTVLMEAEERSGAMITAQLALDQGREVLVLRFDPHALRGKGNQQLIEDGALSFASLEEFAALLAGKPLGSTWYE